MIVFLGGMQRSGSTFSFNVVREFLSRRGRIYQEPTPDVFAALNAAKDADHVIIKAHQCDPMTIRLIQVKAVKSIVTIRRPEDAIASWITTFGFDLETSITHYKNWIEMFDQIKNHSLIIRYEELDKNPLYTIWRIAQYIDVAINPIELFGIRRRQSKSSIKEFTDRIAVEDDNVTNIGFSYYDKNSFLHRKHISSIISRSAADRIGAEAVEKIRSAFRNRLDERGYLVF